MSTTPTGLTIVAIGASAGGLSALGELVAALPGDSGFAFIVLQHQAEAQVGKLAPLLGPLAPVPVIDARDGGTLTGDVIHVVPPHSRATFRSGSLALAATGATSPHKPIDELFASLAEQVGTNTIGVVLSGTGDDGTAGLRAIRRAGGITVAQDPQTAEFDEMPRTAIAAEVVDAVLPPTRIGREITLLRRAGSGALGRIFAQLRDLAGIDFASYKRATIERRLDRQLARHHVTSLDEYARYLADHPAEARTLYEDLLVHVTEFFRDRAVLDRVVEHVIPALLGSKPATAPLRVWVPGCSTGEEAYSLAILLLEALSTRGDRRGIQLFGTDLSERAIEIARAGSYPATIATALGPEWLERYFTTDGSGYRVTPQLREHCVFVRHDLAADPPFSRLDLVSCRNVLIYLDQALQKKILALFHYALEQPGFLLLGGSESITGQEAFFASCLPDAPLYRRQPGQSRPVLLFGTRSMNHGLRRSELVIAPDLFRDADHALLARYAPPSVLVDEHFDVVQFRGRTGAFLEPAPGHPQLNVFKMLRERLVHDVRAAAIRAQRDQVAVRAEDLAMSDEPGGRRVDVEVIPLHTLKGPRHYLIVFDERVVAPVAEPRPEHVRRGTGDRVQQLEQELAASREYVATMVAQHVAATDELGVLNEELQSANEELQSSNEELHTAKEELQSTNDELAGVNVDLERGNAELRRLNDDLVNVLASVDLAIVIVDVAHQVRRFTPRARALFKLLGSDVGRPIGDLQPSFPIADLDQTISRVIETRAVHEREVKSADGDHYRMHVRPYETSEHQIAGAVLSFVDVTVLRNSIEESRRARDAERTTQEAVQGERDAFLHAVSHELKTPLNAIVLWTRVIRDLDGANPEIARALDTIEASANTETQLVEDLIDLAQSQAGNAVSIAVRPTDPGPVVDGVIAGLQSTANAKRVTLELDARAGSVLADPRRLRQIVWHLVTNAIKFTPAEGRVRVSARQHDGTFELVVSDNGRGLRADQVRSMFEPFARDDLSTTREHAGLGIGLAFVRHLIDRQAGSIEVTSSGEGQGTAVTVRLPSA